MDLCHQVGLRDVQKIVVVLDKLLNVFEFFTSIVFFFEFICLDLSSHTTVKDDYSFLKDLAEVGFDCSDVEIVLCDVPALQTVSFYHLLLIID